MAGMRHGADNRIVSRIVCADNSLFAATTFHRLPMPLWCHFVE